MKRESNTKNQTKQRATGGKGVKILKTCLPCHSGRLQCPSHSEEIQKGGQKYHSGRLQYFSLTRENNIFFNFSRKKEDYKRMGTNLQAVTWISNIEANKRKSPENEIGQVVIIDDIPRPEDFRLSPEEYKRIYEERLRNGEELPASPEEYTEAYKEGKESRLFSVSWVDRSIDSDPQPEKRQPVVFIEERPAATFELEPEEYNRIKTELELELAEPHSPTGSES